MILEIGKIERKCQLITKDGKYFGYPNDKEGNCIITSDREWHDNPIQALTWNMKLDDVNKVSGTEYMDMDGAELITVTKTITISKDG